ncbi:putative transporter [Janthinobacterium lividum]|nr:putative transporter [Janthinobacterium lividum]STS86202.1 putative transporter [Janthinobacterium lividum]
MSRIMNKNRNVAFGMATSMLLANALLGLLNLIDAKMLPLDSHTLPFELADRMGSLPITHLMLGIGAGLMGLILLALPASLSRKKMLLAGLTLLALATLLTIFTNTALQLLACRLLAGVGSCMYFCAWISIGVGYFPRQPAMLIACQNFISCVGLIVGTKLASVIYDSQGWQQLLSVLVLGGLPLLASLFVSILFLFKHANKTRMHLLASPEVVDPATSPWSSGPLLLAMAAACMASASYCLIIGYTRYLREMQGLPFKAILLLVTVAVGGGALLSPVGGWLGGKFGFFKTLLVAAPMTGLVGILLFTSDSTSLPLLLLPTLLAGFGIQGVFYVNLLAAAAKSVTSVQSMRMIGLFSAVVAVFEQLAHPLFLLVQEQVGMRSAILLQFSGGLLLATCFVWLAQRKLRPTS